MTRWLPKWPLLWTAALLISAGVAALVVSSGGRDAQPEETETARPNIVLIVMDTVRPDRLSVYGHHRPTSPFLEEIAAAGTTFLNAYATSGWTFPSHGSLFTGLYPAAHSAHWENMRLADELVTIAEVLSAAGYRSLGVSQNPLITKDRGFGQGFDHFSDKEGRRIPPDVVGEFLKFLDAGAGEPFFVFANIMAAHAPYNSSQQFFGRFLSDPSYAEQVDWKFDPDVALGKVELAPKLTLHMAEHYDAELLFVDHTIRRMAQALKSRGLWESTLLVVTSDHGEALGERGYVRHQFSLYENVVRIPLIVHYPPLFPARRVPSPVQLTDLFPTLVSILGIDRESQPAQGRSWLAADYDEGRPVITEYYLHKRFQGMADMDPTANDSWSRFNRRLQAIRIGHWKLIRGSDGHLELYDLGGDPTELRDLSGDATTRATQRKLLRQLDKVVAESRTFSPDDSRNGNAQRSESPDKELRALGYL